MHLKRGGLTGVPLAIVIPEKQLISYGTHIPCGVKTGEAEVCSNEDMVAVLQICQSLHEVWLERHECKSSTIKWREKA